MHAYTTMVDRVHIIEQTVKSDEGIDVEQIIEQCETVSDEMQHAIHAFQFYDKLTPALKSSRLFR